MCHRTEYVRARELNERGNGQDLSRGVRLACAWRPRLARRRRSAGENDRARSEDRRRHAHESTARRARCSRNTSASRSIVARSKRPEQQSRPCVRCTWLALAASTRSQSRGRHDRHPAPWPHSGPRAILAVWAGLQTSAGVFRRHRLLDLVARRERDRPLLRLAGAEKTRGRLLGFLVQVNVRLLRNLPQQRASAVDGATSLRSHRNPESGISPAFRRSISPKEDSHQATQEIQPCLRRSLARVHGAFR